MRTAAKVLLGLLFAISLVRAVLYGAFVACLISTPFDIRPLESAMVHYAWRVQHGVALYPDWRTFPYVANFYAPLNFLLVGALGRVAGADIEGLYWIGRGVTVTAVLLTSGVIGAILYRKYGMIAACCGTMVSLGVCPLFGAGLMTRPDALAELFGLTGFFLATSRKSASAVAGGIALYLAAMTKQTALVYLLAAVLGLVVESRARAAAFLFLSVTTALAVTVITVCWWVEPNFLRSLLGEFQTPADFASWWHTVRVVASTDPEFLVLTAIGIALWNTGPKRESSLIALAVLLLATGLITCTKRGSAENYFLGMRSVAALAAGALWHELSLPDRRPQLRYLVAAAAVIACLALSALTAEAYASAAWESVQGVNNTPTLQESDRFYRQLLRTAQDPKGRLLTDMGVLDIHQGARTLFADPYRFKLMVESKLIDPKIVCELIDNQYYDMIVCKNDLFSASYGRYEFGLPSALVDHARIHYQSEGKLHGLFIYMRRDRPSPP